MLKKSFFFLVGMALATGFAGATTAYEALQVVRKARGDAILKQLVEVRGEAGQPQPQSWTILMSDPSARGGIREFVVTDREIASERTPLRSAAETRGLEPLNFPRLNLDSDGAFKLANEQASKARLGFHTVDYTLRTRAGDGAPFWVMYLFDYMGAPVGNLAVSAENGKIVRAFQVDPDSRERPVGVQPPAPAPAETEPSTHFKGGVFGFVEKTAKKVGLTARDVGVGVGTTVRKTTLNVAGTVQETLTGDRTIGVDEEKRGAGQ